MPSTAADPKRVHVAVGVIVDDADRILIARRPDHLHQGGLWEFPGGKVECGEDVRQALQRELAEELEIVVEPLKLTPLMEVCHDYSDKSVLLDVWWVRAFSGEARGVEGQELRWVDVAELEGFEFPVANRAIVQRVRASVAA